ncbi:MAG: hypothetical protein HYT69_01610 [Candidatus Zambryskibacteria bacterium]|nr:hypothetical protein [Candidatus Zambryskibacteria bacterium]
MPEISKKLQKLASAIYLITGFFNDQEPLKWRLRKLSVDLVSDMIKDKTRTVREVAAFFALAKNVGLISDTNHKILAHELSKIEYEQEKPLETIFSREAQLSERLLSPLPESDYIKDNIVEKKQEKPLLKEFGAWSKPSVKKNSRQSIIVNLLKRKKEIMIKDVSPLISDCSEKTVQRELLSMVAAGILIKRGEKRWSRYSLA